MGSPLKIREDRSPAELRRLARREADGRVAARLYAIANALDRTSRAEAARLAGMERQALRDAVLRYNTEDLAGLRDRPKGRPQRRLTEGEEAALAAVILRGPSPTAMVVAPGPAAICAAGWQLTSARVITLRA